MFESRSKYREYLISAENRFESICRRCGRCCGASDNPCVNLVKLSTGLYHCKEYHTRLQTQRTSNGKIFECVSIREHIKNDTCPPGCAYRR